MERPSIYEFAGGMPAFLALAAAHHQRCLDDPVLSHPFLHLGHPDHVPRLAAYWAEVFGGPAGYTEAAGGHSFMLAIHAGQGADVDFGTRFIECFVRGADDAALPDEPAFRAALKNYMTWAVGEVMSCLPAGSVVAADLPMPRWGWDGPVAR